MLAEITDDTNQARAFAFLPATWAIGATVGPLIGGYFSHPAERFPEIFGGSAFLKDYPYFLPCKDTYYHWLIDLSLCICS